jgi:hypothetical protein
MHLGKQQAQYEIILLEGGRSGCVGKGPRARTKEVVILGMRAPCKARAEHRTQIPRETAPFEVLTHHKDLGRILNTCDIVLRTS